LAGWYKGKYASFAGYIGLEQMEKKNQDGNQPTEAQMVNGG